MGAEDEIVDENGVVRIGSVVFALIRPTRGRELAFNHWYERDHYYTAGAAAPGVFSAGRFVQPESGWHLALYFVLPGADAARVAFATEQGQLAAEQDRMFGDREHLHTWTYDVESAVVGSDGVPLALALDHRYAAVSVAMIDGDAPVGAGPALTLRPVAPIMPSTWEGEIDSARRRVVIRFHDILSHDSLSHDSLSHDSLSHDSLSQDSASTSPGSISAEAVWSGGFVPVVFGTDTHIASAE